MWGELETVRTLLELGVEKDAKDDKVRNLMMMMMMMIAMMMMMIMMMMMMMIVIKMA